MGYGGKVSSFMEPEKSATSVAYMYLKIMKMWIYSRTTTTFTT